MKTEAGKFETYYIDRRTGTAHKVLRVKENSKVNISFIFTGASVLMSNLDGTCKRK